MQFSEDFIERVREANDLVDIIGRHTVLKPGGRSLMGLCPFPNHQEKTPSFSVSPDKQLYNCFGCGKSGNIFSFLRDYYGYTFPESIEYLAKRASIPLPKNAFQNEGQKQKLSEQKRALNITAQFFARKLFQLGPNHEVKNYLRSRGLTSKEHVETLGIGWAPEAWSDLVEALQKEKVSLEVAESLGLIKRRKSGDGYFDLFRSRVIFPVYSFSGEVVGFGGRVLGDEKPKYLNSPESSIFKKSKILYGQNWASPFIRQFDEAVIVEGYTDWISLYVNGIQNGIATMGTALTEEHARKIKRWCSKVVCLFDGDEAGKRASERALGHLLSAGVVARGVFLPQGEDPDSYLKKNGASKMKEVIDKSNDLFTSLLDEKLKNYEGRAHEKIEALNWAMPILANLDSRSPLLTIYFQEIDSRLGLGLPTLKNEYIKVIKGKRPQAVEPAIVKKTENKPTQVQKVTIRAKKTDPEFIAFSLALESLRLQEELLASELKFSDPAVDYLWQLLAERHRQGDPVSGKVEAYLASFLRNPDALTLTLEKPYCLLDDKQKAEVFKDCLQAIHKRQLNVQAKKLTKNLGQNAAEKDLEKFLELQRKKQKLK